MIDIHTYTYIYTNKCEIVSHIYSNVAVALGNFLSEESWVDVLYSEKVNFFRALTSRCTHITPASALAVSCGPYATMYMIVYKWAQDRL